MQQHLISLHRSPCSVKTILLNLSAPCAVAVSAGCPARHHSIASVLAIRWSCGMPAARFKGPQWFAISVAAHHDVVSGVQVGHAVCATLTPGHDPVQKVTLIPRGQARGLTWFTPDEDPSLISKQQIMARIVGALGGRAAEEIIFGTPEVTTGASSDLQQVAPGLSRSLNKRVCLSDGPTWLVVDTNCNQIHVTHLNWPLVHSLLRSRQCF